LWTEAIAMGSNKIRNIVADKMDNARETMSKILNDGMRGGGEGNQIDGLPAICDDGMRLVPSLNLAKSVDIPMSLCYN
jgi:hypothetical protein